MRDMFKNDVAKIDFVMAKYICSKNNKSKTSMPFHFLSQELAIDLGTTNTVIFQNGSIILDEPSIIAKEIILC